MRTARLVGLSPDGKSLIVATESGEELAIAADDRLRAAVRGDRPRLGQLEIEMESSLSPRDIQTRIRAGESLEDVARVAGIPLDRVERFAAPVLAEREHIAAQAMSASVRRRGETSGHRSLRITVTERLLGRGVDIDTIAWDSYRMDDGRWAVTADYLSGRSRAARLLLLRPARPLLGRRQRRGPLAAGRALAGEGSATGPAPADRARRPSEDDTEPTLDLSDDLALVRATQESRRTDGCRPEAPAPGAEPSQLSRMLRPVADLPPQLGGDGYSEDSPGSTPGSATRARCRRPAGAAGWEPAIVVNYPVEPSLLAIQRARPADPGRAGRGRAGSASARTSRDRPIDRPAWTIGPTRPHEFEVEVLAEAGQRPRTKPVGASGPRCPAGTRSCSADPSAPVTCSTSGSPPAATGRSGSVIQSLHEPG